MATPKKPIIDLPAKEDLSHPYQDISTEGLQAKILKLMQFFDEHGIKYDKFEPKRFSVLEEEKKKAYPNYDQYMYIPAQRDLKKWLETVRRIYAGEKGGMSRVEAVRQATNGWNVMETFDFLNWLRFYQEGTHLKYKTAQLWYENGQPGYFLQIKPDAPKPAEPVVDVDAARDSVDRQEERKQVIEKQRQKIIGRLDSAEKLLRSPEGQIFAGPELENLMEAIYSLKKKVQLVNKLSTSTRLYEDMIVREGNVLMRKGFVKAAQILYSVAQANNPPPPGTGLKGPITTLPAVVPPDDPSGAGHPGAPGGLPSYGPGMPQPPKNPPSTSENQPFDPKSPAKMPDGSIAQGPPSPMPEDAPKGIEEFLEGTETAGKTVPEDKQGVEDNLEVEDDTLEVVDNNALLVTEAQMAPPAGLDEDVPMTTRPHRPKPPTPTAPQEDVTGDTPPANEAGVTDAPAGAKDFDRIIDSALANVTVADTVAKLEDISKIFKTREIPRQLALVDMMLDSLGLASYFPTLSEAINKSLESNNYVSTRLEDIIARLRGALGGREVDLKGDKNPQRAGGVAQSLQDQTEKEDARKQMRKDQETAELQGGAGKESPQVDIGEDLGAPPAGPGAPPAAAPAAAPPVARPLG